MTGPIAWLRENPSALVKATAIEALRRDAPEGVVEGLLPVVRAMTRGASELDRFRHVADALRGAQGLRDRGELEPVLGKALAEAPDAANRQKIESMLDLLKLSETDILPAAEELMGPDGIGSGSELTSSQGPSSLPPSASRAAGSPPQTAWSRRPGGLPRLLRGRLPALLIAPRPAPAGAAARPRSS